jgi:hypothetical protein
MPLGDMLPSIGFDDELAAVDKRLFAEVLICVKVALRHRVHKAPMSEDFTPSNEVACPICGRPMTFQIIRRAFTEDLYAFECTPCGLSMTEPESSTTPAIVPESTPF